MNNLPKRGAFSPGVWKSVWKNIFYRDVTPIRLLLQGNLLVDRNNKIALLWSAKSGSTFITKWFFDQMGLLEVALDYHRSVHTYRIDIYRYSEEHRKSLNEFIKNSAAYTVVKITRHPLKRTVSSFIHTNKFNYSDGQLSKFLGREISAKQRFSFREFVKYLGSIDIYKCNAHYRAQVDPYELSDKIKVNRVVDLDNALEQVSRLEDELGLKKSNLRQISESKHHTSRTNIEGFYGDTIDFFGKRGTVIPRPKNFYDDELIEQVGLVYHEDFKRYGYSCSIMDMD